MQSSLCAAEIDGGLLSHLGAIFRQFAHGEVDFHRPLAERHNPSSRRTGHAVECLGDVPYANRMARLAFEILEHCGLRKLADDFLCRCDVPPRRGQRGVLVAEKTTIPQNSILCLAARAANRNVVRLGLFADFDSLPLAGIHDFSRCYLAPKPQRRKRTPPWPDLVERVGVIKPSVLHDLPD